MFADQNLPSPRALFYSVLDGDEPYRAAGKRRKRAGHELATVDLPGLRRSRGTPLPRALPYPTFNEKSRTGPPGSVANELGTSWPLLIYRDFAGREAPLYPERSSTRPSTKRAVPGRPEECPTS